MMGCAWDMKLLAAELRSHMPASTVVMIPTCNEGRTERPIAQQAVDLALEVTDYAVSAFGGGGAPDLDRVSFVAYSMGGVVVREAVCLESFRPLRGRLHAFVSLATPHLGNLGQSATTDAGMWAFRKWKSSESLKELLLADQQSPPFMCKLAANGALQAFRHITFFASEQDRYVPFASALVAPSSKVEGAARAAYESMRVTILGDEHGGALTRVRVSFELSEATGARTVDELTGRAAHLRFVESAAFARILARTPRWLGEVVEEASAGDVDSATACSNGVIRL